MIDRAQKAILAFLIALDIAMGAACYIQDRKRTGERQFRSEGYGQELIDDMRGVIAGVVETFEAGKQKNTMYLAGLIAIQTALEKEKEKIDEEISHLALMFAEKADKAEEPDPLDETKVKEMESALEKRMRKEDM